MTAEEEKYLCKFYTFFWKCRQSQFEYTAALITQKAICSHIRTLLGHILAKTTAKYSRNCLYTTTFSISFLWHNRCSVISGLQDAALSLQFPLSCCLQNRGSMENILFRKPQDENFSVCAPCPSFELLTSASSMSTFSRIKTESIIQYPG